jgi:putative DNA primase/helicase
MRAKFMSKNTNASNGFDSSDSILPESTQSCQDLSKSTQTCRNLSEPTQTYSKFFLNTKHQADIQARGLLNNWTRSSSRTVTAEEASFYLGHAAKSGGILFIGQNGQVQFLPDTPKKKKNGKDQKYDSPSGEFDAFLPPSPDNPLYWEIENLKRQAFYLNGHPYILITEGIFKAIAGCSNGIPTISLLGVEQGLTGKAHDVEGKRFLVDALRIFAEAGFGFIIAFDADATTNLNVWEAQKKLAKQLAKFKVPVRIITGTWVAASVIEGGEVKNTKGMDDFIQHKGIEEFRALLTKAKLFDENDSEPDGNDKKSRRKSEDVLANKIAEKYRSKLAWHIPAQCWMRYEADSETMGIWSEEPKEIVRGLVMADLEVNSGIYSAALVSNICTHLQSLLGVKRWNDAATDLIPLKNGVFNFKTGKFKKHQPGYFLTWCLPYNYKPDATCEPIIKWLEEAAGDKQVARLLIAYLRAILTGRTDIHRLLELVGPGGSGKSTYSRLAQALIGTENTHTTTLVKLEGSRFETACLWNKRLAIINDSERYAGNVTVLKAATGGDTIPHEVKFVQSQRGFVFDGKVILTSNEIIQSSDYTSGLERRRITVPFLNRVPVESQRNLIEIKGDKVSGEFTDCLPGLFNLVVAMPDEEMEALLLKTDKLCPALAESKAETLLDTNPIAAWLDYCVVHDPDSRSQIGLAIPQKDKDIPTHFLNVDKFLYPSYCNYSKNSGSRTPLGLQRFVKLLDDLAKNQLKIDGVFREKDRSKKSYFVGLRIRQDGLDDDLPSPIFEYTSGEMRRDCGGMRGGMKAIQRRDAGDAEGLLENSKNIEQVSKHTPCDESISPTEELKKPSASPASPGSKALNPPHIPPRIPPHPSAASDPKKPESIAIIEIVEKIRKAITNSDRALAEQILEVLEGKTQEKLRNEVQDALAPSEIKNFKLLAKAEFVKTSPLPASKFKVGDRVQVRSDYLTSELRGLEAVVLKDYCDGVYRIDFGRKVKIPYMQPKQIFDMDKKYFQIVTKDESDLQIPF